MAESEVRDRLLSAGVELLAEAGTDALSLREIARRAGVSHGAPRRYFPTHQSLLAALAQQGYARLGEKVTATLGDYETPPREAILAMARAYVAFAAENPGMYALMFRHDLLRGNGVGLRAVSTALFGVLVNRLVQAGAGKPEVAAATLWAALHGIAQLWQWGSLQVPTGLGDPEPLLAAAVDAHLGGRS